MKVFLIILLLTKILEHKRVINLPSAKSAIAQSNQQLKQIMSRASSEFINQKKMSFEGNKKTVTEAQIGNPSEAPSSSGQIVSPRILTNNLPVDQLNSILTSANQYNGPQQGPLTILPPRIVTPDGALDYEKNPELALSPARRKKRRLRKRSRSLQMPFLNPGPGYMDIGSNGYSPLSFAMMRPEAASMSPFTPRNSPPPPIRIQLQDPMQDHHKKDIFTASEIKAKQEEIKHWNGVFKDNVINLLSEEKKASSDLKDQFTTIVNKAIDVEKHRQGVEAGARQIKQQIEEKRKAMMKESQFESIYELLKNLPQKMEEKKNEGDEKRLEANVSKSDITKNEVVDVNKGLKNPGDKLQEGNLSIVLKDKKRERLI